MEDTYSHITPFNRILIAGSVILATILQTLDMTIATVALPKMQGEMSATQEQMSWVLTSYIVAAAIMTPTAGVLSALFGRKNVFVICVACFMAASLLCGLSTSILEIVAFRLLQGMFGAALVPLSQATLLDSFPPRSHGAAMAAWSIGVAVGPILGPSVGGYLTEYFNWRWVFFINLPFGLLALFGILSFVPHAAKDSARRFDFLGFVLLSVAIAALQLMLDRGQSKDWFNSPEILSEAVISVLFVYLFVVHMFTANNSFVMPELFLDRNFMAGLVFVFVLATVLLSSMALMSPYLQQLLGYPVLTSGYILAPRGLGSIIGVFVVGQLSARVDRRLLIAACILLASTALWFMSRFTMDVSIGQLVWTGVFQGIGMGGMFVAISTAAYSTLAPRLRTDGAVIFSLMRNIAGSIGISFVFTLLAQNTQISHAGIAEHMSPFRDMLQLPNLPIAWDWHNSTGVAALDREVTRQATLIGYVNNFSLLMWFNLLSLPLVFLLSPPKQEVRSDPVVAEV